jgi:hypothetical protein
MTEESQGIWILRCAQNDREKGVGFFDRLRMSGGNDGRLRMSGGNDGRLRMSGGKTWLR